MRGVGIATGVPYGFRQNFDERDGLITCLVVRGHARLLEVLDSMALPIWQLVCLSLAA